MRKIDLSKWPLPRGYRIAEAHLSYDDKFQLHVKLVTPYGEKVFDQSIYAEQVLTCDTYAFGREVMHDVINLLGHEEVLSWTKQDTL